MRVIIYASVGDKQKTQDFDLTITKVIYLHTRTLLSIS